MKATTTPELLWSSIKNGLFLRDMEESLFFSFFFNFWEIGYQIFFANRGESLRLGILWLDSVPNKTKILKEISSSVGSLSLTELSTEFKLCLACKMRDGCCSRSVASFFFSFFFSFSFFCLWRVFVSQKKISKTFFFFCWRLGSPHALVWTP